jgi:hypothetical protein
MSRRAVRSSLASALRARFLRGAVRRSGINLGVATFTSHDATRAITPGLCAPFTQGTRTGLRPLGDLSGPTLVALGRDLPRLRGVATGQAISGTLEPAVSPA